MSSYQLSSRRFSIPTSREKDRVIFSESYSGKEREFWRGVIFADHMRFRFVTFHKNVNDVYLTYMFPMLPSFSLNRSGLSVIYEGNETSDLPNTAAVWGFFTADEKKGTRGLYPMANKFDSKTYKSFLDRMTNVQEELFGQIPREFVHDANPVNRSKAVKEWFAHHSQFVVLPWPNCFGDINPFEKLWVDLEQSLETQHFDSPSELSEKLLSNFDVLTGNKKYRYDLVDDMQQKLKELIKRNGRSIQ